MLYSEFVALYEELAKTSKRLEKTSLLVDFLKKLKHRPEFIYLLKGKVFPDYDAREIGISDKLTIKAIAKASGIKEEEIIKKLKKIGDLGEIAESLISNKKQSTLFHSTLSAEKVFENLRKLVEITGIGTVEKKLALTTELLNSATDKEAKYIIRTLLSDLRVGVADGIIKDALAEAFCKENENAKTLIQEAYDMSGDFAIVFEASIKGEKALKKVSISPDRPINVMLAVKAENLEDAFKICGAPAALEYKYDGFRMVISYNGKNIKLFTRRLEDVTNQFPDVIEAVKKYVKGNSFIIDSEIIGFNPNTKKYMPFQAISQRIKRKYDIDKLKKELPVEVDVFDILYYNGKTLMHLPFIKRRKLVEKIIEKKERVIKPSEQLITSDIKKAEEFYKKALKEGEEGLIIKNLNAQYKQGRYVGYMAKLKPETKDIDLVIIGAEYGSGKRGGWLTSYILACKNNDDFLEIGKVSSGLKEKTEEGTTYEEMTSLLKPLIIKEKGKSVSIKPKIVVSVTYQNIQSSPSYKSGFALRFPRIAHYRPDRSIHDIANLDEIKKLIKTQSH